MMQDDSNGEASFEFVERKVEGISLVDNAVRQANFQVPSGASLVPPTMPTQLAVEPPSALPSFIESSSVVASNDANPSTSTSAAPTTDPGSSSASVAGNPAASAFYPKTFSPAIPASKGSDASLSTTDSALEGDGTAGVSSQLLGWVKGAVGGSAGILSRVTEKAKNSMNSMITTLDPQMKEFLYSGGAVDIIVASDKEVKVSAIREAFQGVFGKATVTGLPVNTTAAAAQPVGFAAGVRAAEERIATLRSTHNIAVEQTVLAVENFLVEIGESKWFDVGVLLLNDPARGITLETFTQHTPVPAAVVALAVEDTPKKYPFRWSGLGVTVGSIMANNLQVDHSEWHQALTGVSRREMIYLSAKTLAGLYKSSVGPML